MWWGGSGVPLASEGGGSPGKTGVVASFVHKFELLNTCAAAGKNSSPRSLSHNYLVLSSTGRPHLPTLPSQATHRASGTTVTRLGKCSYTTSSPETVVRFHSNHHHHESLHARLDQAHAPTTTPKRTKATSPKTLWLRWAGKEVEKGVGRPQVVGGKSSGGV